MIKRYTDYKNSGVEWIGEIPKHWIKYNLQDVADKNRYSFTGGPFGSDLKSEEYTDKGVRIIQLQNIGVGEFLNHYKIYTSESKADQLYSCNIFPNDIIIAKMADPVARACLMPDFDERYLMASDGIRLEVNEVNFETNFILYAINSNYFRFQAELNSSGTTRLRIGLNILKKLKLYAPSKVEQTQIANYLEQKTTQINKTITQKQRLIELYKEERQAIINHAVTKGIDPNVEMKYSGVEWIGEIPKHWKINKLKRFTNEITNGFVGATRNILKDSGVKYIQSLHVKENTIKFNKPYFVSQEWSKNHSRSILKENDILVVQTGAGTGNIGIVPKEFEGCNCHALIIIRTKSDIIKGKYLLRFLTSNYGYHKLKSIQTGALHPHINSTIICDIPIVIPPIEEQEGILTLLNKSIKITNDKISLLNQEIALLEEYKQALIFEAITGKIDVR